MLRTSLFREKSIYGKFVQIRILQNYQPKSPHPAIFPLNTSFLLLIGVQRQQQPAAECAATDGQLAVKGERGLAII